MGLVVCGMVVCLPTSDVLGDFFLFVGCSGLIVAAIMSFEL
jgi:hypothetical protein